MSYSFKLEGDFNLIESHKLLGTEENPEFWFLHYTLDGVEFVEVRHVDNGKDEWFVKITNDSFTREDINSILFAAILNMELEQEGCAKKVYESLFKGSNIKINLFEGDKG